MKKKSKVILPIVAIITVFTTAIILLLVPSDDYDKGDKETGSTYTQTTELFTEEKTEDTTDQTAESSSDDNTFENTLIINKDDLSNDQITFISPIKGSKIELVVRLEDDNTAKVALGTCQSCNGSPGAYYTQEGDLLKCNNCGLTFPLNVLDEPGAGCHSITLDENVISYEDGNAVI